MNALLLKTPPRFRTLLRPIIAVGLVQLVTFPLWGIRDALTLANFSLIYLLLTLVIAIWLGTISSLTAAFVSFFCFNFFLIKPYYTLAVEDPRDLLDLIIYLLVALITGQLTAYARRQAEVARRRASEQNILYELSSAFNRLTEQEDIYQTLQEMIQKNLPVASCVVLPSRAETPPNDNESGVYLLIGMDEQVYGTLQVVFLVPPLETQRRFLMACVVQAAMALQRIELAEDVQRSRAVQEADRLKTTLLRAVSHDLRTPITIIKTAVSNLQSLSDQVSGQEKTEILQVIGQEADTLNQLVGNLLDMSRLEAGALKLYEDWTAVSEIAGDVAAHAWKRHQVTRIHLDFPDDMPLVRCDQGLVLQALSNITDNALRYEPSERQVEIRGSFDEQEVRIAVANHGPTILPEDKRQLMEPFYRGSGGHLGLGLAISKGIVAAHHGRIWVEDTPGGGATFVMTLPRVPLTGELDADTHRG